MDIRKIAQFSTEEVEALKTAGTIIGNVNKAFIAGEITELSTEDTALLKALQEVIAKVSK